MNYQILLITLFIIFHLVKGDSIVNTNNGPVRGKTVASGKVDAFLGIPYAEPPVDSLRFAKPAPKTWHEVYEATKLPPPCIQIKFANSFFSPPDLTDMSEDCLYLNVWVPRLKTKDELKTIMVWIHGGGFLTGSSSMKLYDGAKLSEYGDVIVVTINYRLGSLGFFTGFIDDAPGNVGLHDQVMAIRWIKENAKHFSGDPDNIVLFGESAGAFSVSMHQISPLSKNLFKRAILQSGSAISPLNCENNTKLSDTCQAFAELLGCVSDGAMVYSNPETVVECMRNVPVEIFAESDLKLITKQNSYFQSRIGDDFLPEGITVAYKKGHFKDSEVLVGFTKDEGPLLLVLRNPGLFGEFGEKDVSKIFNETTAYDFMNLLLKKLPGDKAEDDDIIRSYLNRVNNKTGNTYVNAVSESFGDYIVKCGQIYQAELQSMKDNQVFFYVFDHRPSTSPYAEWMGVLHFDEIQYVFGNPMYQEFSEYEEELSMDIMDMWVSFAKTGNPNIPGGVTWPRYTYDDPKYFIIGNRDSMGTRPDNYRCDKWRNVFQTVFDDEIIQALKQH